MKFKLEWMDDFSKDKLDTEIWNIDTGGHGFGNNESQYYKDSLENVYVDDEILHLKAIRENFENREYTSGKISTLGKKNIIYGKLLIKAKPPLGKGTWPAIWMMPKDFHQGVKWPLCGEIDIMEHVGRDKGNVHFSLHTGDFNHKNKNQYTHIIKIDDVCERFHEYGIIWTKDFITFLLDDKEIVTYKKGSRGDGIGAWPFDKPFYLIINLAIGGYWGGEIDNTVFPVSFDIKYVKYFSIIE